MNSALVEFQDGARFVTSRNYLRRRRMAADPIAVARCIAANAYQRADEAQLQAGIQGALEAAGYVFEREFRLSAKDRVDFLVGRVAVEVKVQGSTPAVRRQLARYAASSNVDAVILVTTKSKHAMEAESLNGKPLIVVKVRGGEF
jgi:hypothetical protein